MRPPVAEHLDDASLRVLDDASRVQVRLAVSTSAVPSVVLDAHIALERRVRVALVDHRTNLSTNALLILPAAFGADPAVEAIGAVVDQHQPFSLYTCHTHAPVNAVPT